MPFKRLTNPTMSAIMQLIDLFGCDAPRPPVVCNGGGEQGVLTMDPSESSESLRSGSELAYRFRLQTTDFSVSEDESSESDESSLLVSSDGRVEFCCLDRWFDWFPIPTPPPPPPPPTPTKVLPPSGGTEYGPGVEQSEASESCLMVFKRFSWSRFIPRYRR